MGAGGQTPLNQICSGGEGRKRPDEMTQERQKTEPPPPPTHNPPPVLFGCDCSCLPVARMSESCTLQGEGEQMEQRGLYNCC